MYQLLLSFLFVFFFKQKTAYEMRISDWSSDVCSSDLAEQLRVHRVTPHQKAWPPAGVGECADDPAAEEAGAAGHGGDGRRDRGKGHPTLAASRVWWSAVGASVGRSEEHTSELQSLMRISYAVFCLKKQKKIMKSSATIW